MKDFVRLAAFTVLVLTNFVRYFDPKQFYEFLHLKVFVYKVCSNFFSFLRIYEIFGVFKCVKGFMKVQMRSRNRRTNNTNFKTVKTMIETQWKIGYT